MFPCRVDVVYHVFPGPCILLCLHVRVSGSVCVRVHGMVSVHVKGQFMWRNAYCLWTRDFKVAPVTPNVGIRSMGRVWPADNLSFDKIT